MKKVTKITLHLDIDGKKMQKTISFNNPNNAEGIGAINQITLTDEIVCRNRQLHKVWINPLGERQYLPLGLPC